MCALQASEGGGQEEQSNTSGLVAPPLLYARLQGYHQNLLVVSHGFIF